MTTLDRRSPVQPRGSDANRRPGVDRPGRVPEAARLLTATDVAELLSVSLRSVWSFRSSGRLKGVKVGPRCTRFRPEDVRAFLDRAGRPAPHR